MVRVRYTGPTHTPLRYDIYVDGVKRRGNGYRFGTGALDANVTDEEADVLLGHTPALFTPDGQPINAVVRRSGEPLQDEQWELGGANG